MKTERNRLTIIHADTEAEAVPFYPPVVPGCRREISVEEHPNAGYKIRVQIVDHEERPK